MVDANFSVNPSSLLFTEDFTNYTIGNLAGQGGWTKFGTGPDATVSNTIPLTYANYNSGGGQYMAFATNSATSSRVYRDFPDTSYSLTNPGTVIYCSLLLNLSATSTIATNYFFSLGTAPGTSNYYAKLFAQQITASTYYLGVSKSSNTANFSTKVLNTGQTYLVLIRYNANNTALNQSGNTCYMWINPSGSLEPDTALADAKVFAGQSDFTSANCSAVMWHDRGTSNPLGTIDGIRVAGSLNSSSGAWTYLNPGSLPVELTTFTASVANGVVNLSWKTATEINNSGFEVERKSVNDNSWTTLSFVKGFGNSLSAKQYSYTDNSANSGKFNYRLKQIDQNGTFKYSDAINVDVNVPGTFTLSQNYPNPFNPSTKIDYQLPVDSKVKIEIFSITGQKVADLVNTDQGAGFYSITVGANTFKNISSGVYIYKMTTFEKVSGKNFVSSKKLMLLK